MSQSTALGEVDSSQVSPRRVRLNPIVGWLLLGSFLSVVPILVWGPPDGPDLASHLRFVQAFDGSIRQGNIYPAWQTQANAGYGDGSFRIYSPLAYYALSATKFFTGNWYLSLNIFYLMFAVSGALSVFYWVRAWGTEQQALLAGLIYCFAPFRLNEIYQAAMLSQFAGGIFFALLLGATERLTRKQSSGRRLAHLALFAAAFAALIVTHIPLAMMAILTVPLYAALRFDPPIRFRRLFELGVAGTVGAMLSGFYLVTLLKELPLVKGATIKPGQRFSYSTNFVFSGSQDSAAWYVELLFVATIVSLVPALIVLLSRRASAHQSSRKASWLGSKVNRKLTAISCVALFTLFMTTQVSKPLWAIVPKLSAMEFPWRWLSVASILVSGLAGFSLPLLWKEWMKLCKQRRERRATDPVQAVRVEKNSRVKLVLALGCLIVVLGFSLGYPVRNALFLPRARFESMLNESRSSTGLEEWLPTWTNTDALSNLTAQNSPEVTVDGRNITIQSWQSENRRFAVDAGAKSVARVRTLFYPYWQLQTVSGTILSTHADADGVLLVEIPAGQQIINMTFVRPGHQTVGSVLSIAGLLMLLSTYILAVRSTRRHSSPSYSTIPAPDLSFFVR